MSGRYKHRIEFYVSTMVTNSRGRANPVDTLVFKSMADVSVISSTERINTGVELDVEFISVLMRSDTRLAHNQRLKWKGNVYQITGLKPDNRNRRVVINAQRDIRNG